MKIMNEINKTITFQTEHLYPTYVRRLSQGSCKPIEISFDNVHVNIRDLYKNKIKSEGFKVIFHYKDKDYLLIYNK